MFLEKAVQTSFSSVIRSQIHWTVFTRTRSKSSYTHGRTIQLKVKQESEERNADKEYCNRHVAEAWAMRKSGLRRLSKCELREEYRDSIRQNIEMMERIGEERALINALDKK